MKEGQVQIFRFIRLADANDAMAAGWVPTSALEGTPHSNYSVLMRWLCACPEAFPIPKRQEPRP